MSDRDDDSVEKFEMLLDAQSRAVAAKIQRDIDGRRAAAAKSAAEKSLRRWRRDAAVTLTAGMLAREGGFALREHAANNAAALIKAIEEAFPL